MRLRMLNIRSKPKRKAVANMWRNINDPCVSCSGYESTPSGLVDSCRFMLPFCTCLSSADGSIHGSSPCRPRYELSTGAARTTAYRAYRVRREMVIRAQSRMSPATAPGRICCRGRCGCFLSAVLRWNPAEPNGANVRKSGPLPLAIGAVDARPRGCCAAIRG
jgi:hypothetical protein